MTWTDGYIADVGYPACFYKEMQPLWLSTMAGLQGFSAPDVHQPFVLCEPGCGVGINLLVAAACHPDACFVGVDFNAAQLDVGCAAAAACGIENIEFIHADFAGFADSNNRQFDFITSHGVWSWIAPHQQASLLDVAARGLKPGGLFCLHYMCHPGSTALLPLQHLLNLCAHLMPGPSPRKAQTGLKLLQQLAAGGLYAEEPAMLRHLANMAQRPPADLAHEFLTDHWQPQHSIAVHQKMGEAGLSFLCSADAFNNLDVSLSIPGRMQDLIRRTAVPALAETLKDMARHAHQRMDIFQKEPARLDYDSFTARLHAMRFHLLPDAPPPGPISFSTPIGPITGPEAIFAPLLQRLAASPATGAELAQLPVFSGDFGTLLQALQLLMMREIAHPGAIAPPADRISRLSDWFGHHDIVLTIIEECATAMKRAGNG